MLETMRARRCHWCHRLLGEHDSDWRIVGERMTCDECWSKADVEIPLDYTEDEGDD